MQGWTASSSMASMPAGGQRPRQEEEVEEEERERRAQPPADGPGAAPELTGRGCGALRPLPSEGAGITECCVSPPKPGIGASPPLFTKPPRLEEIFKIIRFKRPPSTSPCNP